MGKGGYVKEGGGGHGEAGFSGKGWVCAENLDRSDGNLVVDLLPGGDGGFVRLLGHLRGDTLGRALLLVGKHPWEGARLALLREVRRFSAAQEFVIAILKRGHVVSHLGLTNFELGVALEAFE